MFRHSFKSVVDSALSRVGCGRWQATVGRLTAWHFRRGGLSARSLHLCEEILLLMGDLICRHLSPQMGASQRPFHIASITLKPHGFVDTSLLNGTLMSRFFVFGGTSPSVFPPHSDTPSPWHQYRDLESRDEKEDVSTTPVALLISDSNSPRDRKHCMGRSDGCCSGLAVRKWKPL